MVLPVIIRISVIGQNVNDTKRKCLKIYAGIRYRSTQKTSSKIGSLFYAVFLSLSLRFIISVNILFVLAYN